MKTAKEIFDKRYEYYRNESNKPAIPLEARQLIFDAMEEYASQEEEYEPYFGWCDVDGCKEEGSSGGHHWRETGYWTICHKHGTDHRDGKKQPKMKQAAIDKENTRDKITGYLPPPVK